MRRETSLEERKRIPADAMAEHSAMPMEPLSVRVAVAVKLTGIPRTTLYELIGAGAIETVKIGRSTFILYASLKRLLEKV